MFIYFHSASHTTGCSYSRNMLRNSPAAPSHYRGSHNPQALHDLPPPLPVLTSLSPSSTLLQTHGTLCCSSYSQGKVLPQSLCTGCALCLGSNLPPIHVWLLKSLLKCHLLSKALPNLSTSIIIPHPLLHLPSPLPLFLSPMILNCHGSYFPCLFFYLSPPLGCQHHRVRNHICCVHWSLPCLECGMWSTYK